MREKPIKGQKLYSLNVGNAARRSKGQVLTPVIVTKVGRKYFVCERVEDIGSHRDNGIQYYLNTWRQKTDYSATSLLYENEQDWVNTKEIVSICKYIEDEFDYGRSKSKLSLQVLRSIEVLIKGGLNAEN